MAARCQRCGEAATIQPRVGGQVIGDFCRRCIPGAGDPEPIPGFAPQMRSQKECRRALPGHRVGQMNATEQRYALRLENEKAAGKVLSWWFERMVFRLDGGTRWTPDFLVGRYAGKGELTFELVDVKGGPRKLDMPAQRIKAREVAAMVAPLGWRVVIERWHEGRWEREEIGARTEGATC